MNKSQDIIDTIRLYKSHNLYNKLSKNDIVQHIIPSISLNQYKIFRYDSIGIAYAIY